MWQFAMDCRLSGAPFTKAATRMTPPLTIIRSEESPRAVYGTQIHKKKQYYKSPVSWY